MFLSLSRRKSMKENEKYYQYWQNEFDGHNDYMLSNKGNEYYQIREKVLSYVKDGESLLDVGCASGGTYQHIKDYFVKKIKYKGVDYVENFVESCRRRHPEALWNVSDARELKEEDHSWDTVLLYDTIDYLMNPKDIHNWRKALDEALRVARKRLIIVLWSDYIRDGAKIKKYLKGKVKLTEIELYDLPQSPHHMFIGEI